MTEKKIRDSRFDLLALAACDGAKGDFSTLGLAGAAVRSGASTTFGAILEVPMRFPKVYLLAGQIPDEKDPEIDEYPEPKEHPGFLDLYFKNVGSARALQLVQLHFLEQYLHYSKTQQYPGEDGFSPYLAPTAWGAYQIVGWWR